MSPIMFILGALFGLAIGYVTIRLRTKPAPHAPPYRIASGVNGTYEFVYDQSYVSLLIARDVRRTRSIPKDRTVYFETDYTVKQADGGHRLSITVKATEGK